MCTHQTTTINSTYGCKFESYHRFFCLSKMRALLAHLRKRIFVYWLVLYMHGEHLWCCIKSKSDLFSVNKSTLSWLDRMDHVDIIILPHFVSHKFLYLWTKYFLDMNCLCVCVCVSNWMNTIIMYALKYYYYNRPIIVNSNH